MSDPRNPIAGVNLNAFPVFDALARHGSAAGAARELGVTPSAISHTLRELRLVFDDPLFVRTGNSLSPTALARSIAPMIRAALSGLGTTLQARPSFEPAHARGRYVIAATDEIAPTVVPLFIRAVRAQAPGLTLDLRPRAAEAVAVLDNGDADLVLCLQADAPSRVSRARLYTDTVSCVVRRDHPRIRKRMTPKAYAELPHIRVSPEGFGPSAVDTALDALGVSRHIAIYARTFMMAVELVAASDCICTLPTELARAVAPRMKLRVLDPPHPFPSYTIEMAWHVARDEPGLQYLRAQLSSAAQAVWG
ncbi:MAG: LysR family transcriptional regulator [Deltaproteobacteria bacterium]|nr:LysR family transcriptional regulator [Deltaproteobacteria bacterium]